MNRFGERFAFTTFGESHGVALGCVVDGVPAGLAIDEAYIQSEMDRRKPGQNAFATARQEGDVVQIFIGVFEGMSTGTPIAMVIYNGDQKSKDYENVKNIFRPGHADFTYFHKYGLRDHRGGGRSSARETASRVAAGAIAKLMLRELGITCKSGVCAVSGIEGALEDFAYASSSEIFALDPSVEAAQKAAILEAKNAHDSVGGVVKVRIDGVGVGLGEPMYYKLDSVLASAMMGINAAKAVEIGDGVEAAKKRGSQNNDALTCKGFESNHAGGILGGISNGDAITLKVHFKPTPSIFIPQRTLSTSGEAVEFALKGRHDPCVAVRGSVVCEAMAALVIADMLLLNMGRTLEGLKRHYFEKSS